MSSQSKVLLIGYGNPGRLDDGLGPALAEAMEGMLLPNLTVDADYQLTVEDAAAIAEHDVVIFADASVNGAEPFYFKRIEPKSDISFSTHSIQPESVLALAVELFGAGVQAYVLGIRGYDFNEFGQRLSQKAGQNLQKAIEFITSAVENRDFTETK